MAAGIPGARLRAITGRQIPRDINGLTRLESICVRGWRSFLRDDHDRAVRALLFVSPPFGDLGRRVRTAHTVAAKAVAAIAV